MTDAPAPHPFDTDALRKLCEATETISWNLTSAIDDPHMPETVKQDIRTWFAARKALPAILDELDRLHAGEAAGKARVPEEPTKAMLDAARDWSVKRHGIGVGNDEATGCWKAMYAAARAEGSAK